jgi:2-iminobutanoate/2-iminopropanoate deaminase
MKKTFVLLLTMAAATISISAQDTPKAKKESSPSPRRYINLPKPVQAPFSDAVLAGNTLYVAGRIGVDPKTGKPPDDLEQEIRILLDGFKSVVTEAGMTMDDLVFVQVFCPDLSLYGKFNDIYKTYFGKDYPARAFIGSGPLLRGGHFEMNAIAVR